MSGGPSKEFILAEIRRLAAESGGVPPGKERFALETGIKETYWSGRFWARWGDAIAEAGFTPNALQGRKHNDGELLAALARLTQSLGRFPTHLEFKLQRRADPEFPSANVFRTRLGNNAQQIAALADYTATLPEFGDVHSIVAPLVSGSGVAASEPGNQPVSGYVYLLKSGRYYKIGRTNSVGRRERELSIQLPQKVERVHAIETDDPVGIEHYWHRRFREERVRPDAEWFELSKEQVAAFKRRRFQ